MTQSPKAIAATILLTIVCSTSIFAQEMYTSTSIKTVYPATTISTAEENNSSKTAVAANPVIAAKFSTLVPGATDLQWTVSDANCWVSFINNGRKGKASLTLKGKMNYMITDCTMEQLPGAFSKAIKTQYASYQLFNAIEIKAYKSVAYQAIIEDAQGYITLKYTEEGIEEVQQVKKPD